MQLQDIAEIKFVFPEKEKLQNGSCQWITAGVLQPNNVIAEIKTESEFCALENLAVKEKDIIIKRISPQYVNYIDTLQGNVYAGANLIIVRANQESYSKYLAYILEAHIDKLYIDASGSVMPAVSRKGIAELEIGDLPPYRKQVLIGELWWLQKEKNKLKDILQDKETMLLKQQLRINVTKGDK